MTYMEWRCDCGVHCETLAAWQAHRQVHYRDRQRGGPARTLQPCGTLAAYRRHTRRGEPVDDLCRAANAAYQREYQQRRAASR